MSGTKLSSLAGASPLSLSDLFYAVQTPGVGGTKATLAQLETLFSASFIGLSAGTLTGSLTLGGNISAAAWTTAGIKLKGGGSTLTDTTSSGTVALAVTNKLGGNTIAASSATTYTDYGTLYLDVPAAGTNVTITNPWSLIASGAMKSTALTLTGGTLTLNGATSGASVLSAPAVAGSATITLPGVTSTLATLGANTFTGDQTVGSSNLVGWSTDLKLYRDAAGTLAQRNGTNAQTLRVYNTYTDSSNYERGVFDWTTNANVLMIGTEKAGTGLQRDVKIQVAGNSSLYFNINGSDRFYFTTGRIAPNITTTSDLGSSGDRFRSCYLGQSLTGSATTGAIDISSTWNTSGTPNLINIAVTDTASNAASMLIKAVVGSATVFGVDKAGKPTFGTHSALAAETVTGYITIVDAGGTTRKLAVVS